jgi:hypothetical protein
MKGVKYGNITAKNLMGLYEVYYRLWKITFPYLSKTFIFSGTLEGAKQAAGAIQRKLKWSYQPKIKEITERI